MKNIWSYCHLNEHISNFICIIDDWIKFSQYCNYLKKFFQDYQKKNKLIYPPKAYHYLNFKSFSILETQLPFIPLYLLYSKISQKKFQNCLNFIMIAQISYHSNFHCIQWIANLLWVVEVQENQLAKCSLHLTNNFLEDSKY